MMKGFTLIELLAVIVILAIIALIATPIVLSIINDTKESATLRSADFYLDGVELAVSRATLKDVSITDGEYPIMKDGNLCIGRLTGDTCTGDILVIEVKGEKPSNGTIIIESGQIGDVSLDLNNKTVVKTDEGELSFSDSKQNQDIPRYYSWSSGSIGANLPSDATQILSELTTRRYHYYIGLDVVSDEVTAAYLCFTSNEIEYCLKGLDSQAYETNKTILEDAFETGCNLSDEKIYCATNYWGITVYANGRLYASNGSEYCEVNNNAFQCWVK